MTATADYSDGKVPKNETAFPLCRATDSLWNKNVVSLLSSVILAMRIPISCTSSVASWLHEPAVSIATGKKMCVVSSSWYFVVLLSAACLAAAPCSTDVELRWDSAKVSGTVTSHAVDINYIIIKVARKCKKVTWLKYAVSRAPYVNDHRTSTLHQIDGQTDNMRWHYSRHCYCMARQKLSR